MGNTVYNKETITLRGREIPLRLMLLPQKDLKYYPENPRVYTILRADEKTPSQSEIERRLLQRDHVKKLIQSIKANGGLTDPIFVLDGDYVVLEGNSRLAAYRFLAGKDPVKWGKIKCKVLPKDIDEDKIFALLGDYHIIGRQDWAPYEQAGYLYRRHTRYNVTPEQMSAELGLSASEIRKQIRIYSFMVKHDDNNPERWSFYEQYLTKNVLKKARKDHPILDKLVVTKIKTHEIKKAVCIRDELPLIFKAGKKVVNNFMSEKHDFDRAVDHAKHGGAGLHCYQRIKKFKEWISDIDIHEELYDLPVNVQKKCSFQLSKIKASITIVARRLS